MFSLCLDWSMAAGIFRNRIRFNDFLFVFYRHKAHENLELFPCAGQSFILKQYDIINDADNMASLTTISTFTLSITIKMQHPAYNYAECPI